MDTPILVTKLNAPARRTDVVPRPRLLDRLNEGLQRHRRLTVISAPAGYGKTTLVIDWLHNAQQRATGARFAWLSLDEADNDPHRFLTYVLAALERAEPGVSESARKMLQGAQVSSASACLTLLINDLAEVEDRLMLILDDYHLIRNPVLHEAMDFLIEHAPDHVHLVLLTREDPPLALSRLRARGQLTEMRAADLRFTPEETAAFFENTLDIALDDEDIDTLTRRTEGWVASLQLAGMALRAQPEHRAFLSQFGGSHRYVIDYLLDEVLRHQPPVIRDFLTRTAILDRMCAGLCDAVIQPTEDEKPASAILQTLDNANLFLVPLDGHRTWYRYHHLFADALRAQLPPATAKELHQRAAHWFAGHQLWAEAIHHALAAHDFVAAASWIEEAAGPLVRNGQLYTVHGWLDALPAPVLQDRPELTATKALAHLLTGQLDDSESLITALEKDIEAIDDPARRDLVLGKIYAIRAWLADARGEPRSPALAESALSILPEDAILFRILTFIPLSHARTAAGDVTGATEALREAYRLAENAEQPFAAMGALANLAFNLLEQGCRREAIALCEHVLDHYVDRQGRPLPVLGLVYLPMATAHYIGDDLDQAERYASEGLALTRTLLSGAMAGGDAERVLAQVHYARGKAQAAFDLLKEAQRTAERQGVVQVATILASTEMALRLRQDQVSAVEVWLKTLGQPLPARVQPTYLAWLIADQRWDEAGALIAERVEQLTQSGQHGRLIFLLLLQAQVAAVQGRRDEALEPLRKALTYAAPEGYRRPFLDAPGEVQRLLPYVRDANPPFVDDLLARSNLEMPQPNDPATPAATAMSAAPQPLLDPLTDQELRVLDLLAEGCTNREIADALVVTLGTAKWHVHNVLQKLDVSNRTEAVVKAQALGIM